MIFNYRLTRTRVVLEWADSKHVSNPHRAISRGFSTPSYEVLRQCQTCSVVAQARETPWRQKKKLTVADYWNTVMILQYTTEEQLAESVRGPPGSAGALQCVC